MALFKIFRGPEDELKDVPCHDGYAYFTEDLNNLYIDIGNGDQETDRKQVNAFWAEELRKIDGTGQQVDTIEFDDIELKSAIKDVEHGGTGRSTLTANAVLIGDGTNVVKMTVIPENQVLAGSSTTGVKGIDGTGMFLRLTGEAPKFSTISLTTNLGSTTAGSLNGSSSVSIGITGTLGLGNGGTNATTAAGARTNLDVYSKAEVDAKDATSITATLSASGWSSSSGKYVYTYSNTALKCGANGTVPPIITYTSNQTEYSLIESAEAPAGSNIKFTASAKPASDIGIIIIDHR